MTINLVLTLVTKVLVHSEISIPFDPYQQVKIVFFHVLTINTVPSTCYQGIIVPRHFDIL